MSNLYYQMMYVLCHRCKMLGCKFVPPGMIRRVLHRGTIMQIPKSQYLVVLLVWMIWRMILVKIKLLRMFLLLLLYLRFVVDCTYHLLMKENRQMNLNLSKTVLHSYQFLPSFSMKLVDTLFNAVVFIILSVTLFVHLLVCKFLSGFVPSKAHLILYVYDMSTVIIA